MNKLIKQISTGHTPFLSLSVASVRKATSKFVIHHNTSNNNLETYFEFTEENYETINEILNKYPKNYKRAGLLPLLMLAQKQNNNFLSLSAMKKVAKVLEIPEIYAFEVATFYAMYNRDQVGKYHLQFCGTTPCLLCRSDEVMKAAMEYLGIGIKETTADNMFTIEEVECLGACVNAPVLQVNNEEFYEDLTPEIIVDMLKTWEKGGYVKPGPQIDSRKNSEGPLGKSTLIGHTTKIHDRDFGQIKKDFEQAKEEAKV